MISPKTFFRNKNFSTPCENGANFQAGNLRIYKDVQVMQHVKF